MSNRHPHMGGYAVGRVVGGRYRIEMVLAQRSASVVCLGLDLAQAHNTVLIYSLPDIELAHRVELLRRLFQDAKIVNVLKRDDLVQILDFNIEPVSSTLFLVMVHRTGLPADQLVALGGPENKTAAVFVEMARGLLESYDAQFFQMGDRTNPGVRVADLPAYQSGPRTATLRRTAPMSTTGVGPLPSAGAAPLAVGRGNRADVVYGRDPNAWQELGEAGPRARPGAADVPKLTKSHLIVVGGVTIALATALFMSMGDDRQYYGPRQIERGGWHDYYGRDRAEYGGPGLSGAQRPTSQITVTSSPEGALVYAGIKQLGATPLHMDRPANRRQMLLRISKPGYIDRTVVVTSASPAMISVVLGRSSLTKSAAPDGDSKAKEDGLDDVGRLPRYDIGDPKTPDSPTSGYDTKVR